LTFSERDHKDGDEFLNQIVRKSGDETWVSFMNAETKEQSMQWMHTHLAKKPKKFKQMSCSRKLMAIVFCDRKGVLVGFMQQWTSEVYCVRNTKKLRRTIQNKRRGMLTSGVVLLHDNTLPHTAAHTRALLDYLNWELFDHSPYSHDLAPSDYHLFTYLKNWLGSQWVNNN
jgi:histone-lysine N-methyltransferase SETMAR